MTEISLVHVPLVSEPSDGGLNVLRDLFARSDTTLTTVTLHHCYFGSQEDASHLLAAILSFQHNRHGLDHSKNRQPGMCRPGIFSF